MGKSITNISKTERMLLSRIRKRPGMYIGTLSLEFLLHFLHGYECAVGVHSDATAHHILPDNFNDFVAKRLFGHSDTVLNYCSLIYKTENNEEKALSLFFNLIDECLISQGFEPISDCEE